MDPTVRIAGMYIWSTAPTKGQVMFDEEMKVLKRQAATRQLETAIKLFLENRDLISAYTLCCAADGILEGIYRNDRAEILDRQREQFTEPSGFRFSWKEELEIRIKPEHCKEFFQRLNKAQNFFKHADKDHDGSYEFKGWEQSGIRIFSAVMNYMLIFGETTLPMNVFLALYVILNPDLLAEGNPLSDAIAANRDPMELVAKYSQEEIAAIGYSNLKSTCPELFVQP